MPKVNVIAPDGRVLGVEADKVPTLETLGYRRESVGEGAERRGREQVRSDYESEKFLTAVEGLRSGLTFGLSDAEQRLAGGLLGDSEEAAARAHYNPGTRVVSEIVGALIPAVLVPGAGPARAVGVAREGLAGVEALRAGEAASTGLRGYAAAAKTGAAYGAAAGLGGEISHASLSDDPLTVEGALAGMGVGAFFGAGFGAAAHGMGELGGKVRVWRRGLEKETEAAVGDLMDAGADSALAREHGIIPDGPEAGMTGVRQLPSEPIVRPRGAAGHSVIPDDAYRGFSGAVKDVKTTARDLLSRATEAHNPREAVRMAQEIGEAGTWLTRHVQADPERLALVRGEIGAANRAWGRVMRAATGTNAEAFNARFGEYKTVLETISEKAGIPQDFTKFELKTARQLAELRTAVEHLDFPADPSAFLAMRASTVEAKVAAVERVMKSGMEELAPVRQAVKDAVDDLAFKAGIASEAPTHQKLRDVWEIARSATPAESPGVTKVGRLSRTKNGTDAHWLRRWTLARIAGRVAKRGAKKAGFGMVGGEIAYSAGWMLGAGKAITAGVLGAKSAALQTVTKGVEKFLPGAGKVVGKVGPLTPLLYGLRGTVDKDEKDAFKNRSAEIRALGTGAGRNLAFSAAMELQAAGHPEFAFASYEQSKRVLDVLMKRLPKDPPGTRWGTESIWDLPEEQRRVFAQEYHAATRPAEFLAWAAQNPRDVLPSAVDVVDEAWPALYTEFRVLLAMRVGSMDPGTLSHEDLVSLSVLTKSSMAPTMTPEFISGQMAGYINQPPALAAPGGKTKGQAGRPAGLEAQSEVTPAQSILSR